jgi:ABC-type ATPase involved in cell division
MPSINHISAVYVTGIAGSGKSSVIQMGLKLAVEILEDSGYMNTAVLLL